MKVHAHIVRARREQLAHWLRQHSYASLQQVCRQFKVSEATARRDLHVLELEKKIVRTYGGALAEFNQGFAPFQERRKHASTSKHRIAEVAYKLIKPNQTYFFDAGSTIYALAEVLQQKPVTPITVVTNNLPVAEALAAIPHINVHLLGGQLLPKQSVLFGKTTSKTLRFYTFDIAFLSAEGFDEEGLWNSQKDVVDCQKAAIARSKHAVACLDGSKLDHAAPVFLAKWDALDTLITTVHETKLSERKIPREKLTLT